MSKQGDLLWFRFVVTLQKLRIKYPDIKMWQLLSKLKLWLGKNYYANKAIYFLYDYSYGVKLSSEGMFGMQAVLEVLKLFYDKCELIDPPR